jgi:4-amino-4-deoxy-L-arabinose transferase-like glycosyltransferase
MSGSLLRAFLSMIDAALANVWARRLQLSCVAMLGLALLSPLSFFSEVKFWDEQKYLELARNLLEYDVYGSNPAQPDGYRPPGYIFFITPFVATGFGKQAVSLVQVILWALNANIAARIAFAFGGPAASGAALIFAFGYPIFAYTALTVYPQTLTATLFLVAIMLLFGRGEDKSVSFGSAFILGLLWGLLILVTPVMVLILAGVALISVFLAVVHFRHIVIVGVVACVTLAPWVVRNWVVLGSPTIATNGAEVFYLGNSADTIPELGRPLDADRYTGAAKEFTKEMDRDAFFRKSAMTWIEEHPKQAFVLYLAKLSHFFGFREEFETKNVATEAAAIVMFLSYYPLLALAMCNVFMWRWRPPSRKEIMLYLIYLGGAAAYAIFFTRIRYRIPFDYLLVVVAAVGLSKLLDCDRRRQKLV